MRDILYIEAVQRKFTKRIPDMSGLTYHSKLIRLGLESLEVRRLRAHILLRKLQKNSRGLDAPGILTEEKRKLWTRTWLSKRDN